MRLDLETLRLVQSFLDTLLDGCAVERHVEQAWDLFYEACAPLIHKLAHHGSARPSNDDEDRAQEVWLCLLVHLSQYDPERGAFTVWLGSVVRNALVTQDRNDRAICHLDIMHERRLPSREVEAATHYDQCQTRRDIESATAELRSKIPEITYRIVYAHCFEEKSFAEIAASLGLPVKQVRDRHYRAIARFRRLLARRMSDGVEPFGDRSKDGR